MGAHRILLLGLAWVGLHMNALAATFIENEHVKLGVDLASGGAVMWFSEKASGRNLLNHYDKGRFIQQSYYGVVDGSDWNGKPWRWNPVQGGGWRGQSAVVLEQRFEGDSLYVKSRPAHWATGALIEDAVMEQRIVLDGPVARIRYTFTYSGDLQHPAVHQELPAVFVDYDLPHLVFYDGDAPWTGAPVTRRIPGWPNEAASLSEPWAAYVDDRNWGLGVCVPGTYELTTYRFAGDGKTGPAGSACSYFAPIRTMAITPGFVFEYEVFLAIGMVDELRDRFRQLSRGDARPAGNRANSAK
jgi:hypothetical protein